MHLLLDNAEVHSRRVTCPPPDAIESVCQLFGIPYRYDKAGSIFAVQPPLLGSRILIAPLEVRRQPGSSLYELWDEEIRLLVRLLWVCGADVTLRTSWLQDAPMTKVSGSDCSTYWDLALFAVPGQAIPGCIQPLAVYPWWHWGLKSRRLAGELEAWDDGFSAGFKRVTTLRVAGELKKRYSQAIAQIPAPSVLLSVPMIDGYTDRFLDRLSISVSQALLRFFSKPLLPQCVWDAMKRGDRMPGDIAAGMKAPQPAQSILPPLPVPPAMAALKASVLPQQVVPDTGLTQAPLERSSVSIPVEEAPAPPGAARPTPAPPAAVSPAPPPPSPATASPGPLAPALAEGRVAAVAKPVGQVVISDHKPRLVAREPASPAAPPKAPPTAPPMASTAAPTPPVRSADQRRDAAAQLLSRQVPQPASPPKMPPADPQASSRSPGGFLSPLPAGQRDSDQIRSLRESLTKSPELALKQAEEVLSKRGIKPTPERVDEYMKYLRRMLQLTENEGDETG